MMKAFLDDPAVKEKYVTRVKAHAEADEIIHGKYWQNGKGCAVGCTIHSGDHKAYEKELGLPEWLARLEDTLFEGMNNGKAKEFPLKFLQAIPVGVDLEPVRWKFCAFILRENIKQVLSLKIPDELKEQVVKAIRQVLAVHKNAVKEGRFNRSAAESAWSAAESAWSAARSAAIDRYADELLRLLKEGK